MSVRFSQAVLFAAAWLILGFVTLASTGCKQPMKVLTQAQVSTDRVPVHVTPMAPFQVQTLTPIELNSSEIPLKLDGGTPVELKTVLPPLQDKEAIEEMVVRQGSSGTKVAIVDIDGVLLNSIKTGTISAGENPVAVFREKLEHIVKAGNFSAVVLRINSPGGGVTATDIMWRDLKVFQQNTRLPMVACLLDLGAGGAYYLACGCDQIVAHPTTVTGGIGVILNLYNLEDALAQLNIVGVPVKAGKLIDMGSPLRPVPLESRALLEEIATEFHERFKGVVRGARHQLAQGDEKAVVFDGRVMSARKALAVGLVDQLGYLDDAIDIAMQRADCPDATAVVLHRPRDQANTVYDATASPPCMDILPSIPGVDRSQLPTFLYMWQPEPSMAVE